MLAPWGPPPEPRMAFRETGRTASPVYLFVFDSLSYKWSTEDGEFLPCLKNLRELAGQSFTFRQARSPGPYTLVSLAGIVHQTGLEWRATQRETYLKPTEPWAIASRSPSLFQMARQQGYNTARSVSTCPTGSCSKANSTTPSCGPVIPVGITCSKNSHCPTSAT